MSSRQIGLEFRLPAKIRRKGKWFVSSCVPLDVHSQGHTRAEAERNLIDALTFFFESCFERGTLADVLRDAGFVPDVRPSTRRGRASKDGPGVTVPLPFKIRGRVSSAHPRAGAAA